VIQQTVDISSVCSSTDLVFGVKYSFCRFRFDRRVCRFSSCYEVTTTFLAAVASLQSWRTVRILNNVAVWLKLTKSITWGGGAENGGHENGGPSGGLRLGAGGGHSPPPSFARQFHVRHFHVRRFRGWTLGPSIFHVRQIQVRHFQSTLRLHIGLTGNSVRLFHALLRYTVASHKSCAHLYTFAAVFGCQELLKRSHLTLSRGLSS